MTLAPAVTWAYLFPSNAAYGGADLPPAFRSLIGVGGDFERGVLIARNETTDIVPRLSNLYGLVAINGRGYSPRQLEAAGFAYVRRFAVLPSLDHPRWFIPLDTPAVAAAAFCLYTPIRASARLKHLAARMAARSGAPNWYRDHVMIAQRDLPPMERTLAQVFPNAPLRVAFSAGPVTGPEAQRKAAMAVLDLQGRPLAFGKLARSLPARRVLRHEAQTLPTLAERFGDRWTGPRLLFADEVDTTYLTLQSPVLGRAPGPELTEAHRRFLEMLRCGPLKPADHTEMIRTLRTRLSIMPELRDVVDVVLANLRVLVLPQTVTHGDFMPWNLRRQGSTMTAFDWENSELDGLPLIDEFGHLLNIGDLVYHWPVEKAHAELLAVAATEPLGLASEQAMTLAAVCLLHLLARLLELGHESDHPQVVWRRDVLGRVVAGMKVAAAV